MKKHYSRILFIVFAVVLVLSCSKSDNPATDNPVGGDAFRMQMVTINLPNTTLSATEYHGSVGSTTVNLIKSDDHKLLFMMPSSVALGNQDLVINDLNNLKITYNVKDVVLPDTADATISPFQNNLATFQATTLGNTQTQNAITSYNQVYANASAADKTKMATLYYANKAVFDDIILNDFNSITGRSLQESIVLIHKHQAAVLTMAIGLALTLYGAEGIEKAAGIVLLSVGFYKAVGFGQQFATQTVNTIGLEIDNTLGTNNKNATTTNNTTVSLQNNVATSVPFNTKDRTVITADSNKTESGMALFFKYFNILNGYVSQVNPVIQWVNTNVPFANFSLLTQETVPNSSPTVTNAMDAATYQKLSFSITDPALTLQSVSLMGNGQLSLKVKIVGTQTTVQSILKYNYADNYSTFSGTLPITVSNDTTPTVTIGTQIWALKNLDVAIYRNGDPIPQVTDPTAWASLTTGAWCYYNNESVNGATYGKLYNWYAVNDSRGLAPVGYHVPSDAEWTTLTTFLGGQDLAGGKMKETGTTHWLSPNTDATNSSVFTGLPGGFRTADGIFTGYGLSMLGVYGDWWSLSSSTDSAYSYILNYSNGNASGGYGPKLEGFSVRCLKD